MMKGENKRLNAEAMDLSDALSLARLRQKEVLVQIAMHGEMQKNEIDVSPRELIILRDYIIESFSDGSLFSNRDLSQRGPNATRKKTSAILSILLEAGVIRKTDTPSVRYCLSK